MSTAPWGTMNGWLRFETEQRGRWMQQRVQDLRAAQVPGLQPAAAARPATKASPRPAAQPAPRPEAPGTGCAEAA